MLGDRVVKEIPEGNCPFCGPKGHFLIETEDGLRVTECSECGEEIDVEEIDGETDWDAYYKDRDCDV